MFKKVIISDYLFDFIKVMMKMRIAILLGLCMLLNSDAYGSDKELYFSFDYAVFRQPSGDLILEIYYSVPQKLLIYEKTDNGFEASVRLDVTVKNKMDGTEVFSNTYKTPTIVSDTSDKAGMQNLVGQVNYLIKPGSYILQIKGSDFANEKEVESLETEFIAPGNSGDLVEVSDIELASNVAKSDNTNSIFYKNTLEVIPNPSGLFGKTLPMLSYYLEFYALTETNLGNNYSILYSVLNSSRDTIYKVKKDFPTKASSKAEFGAIKVDTLAGGTYSLTAAVFDFLGEMKADSEKKFYVFSGTSSAVIDNETDGFLTSEFAAMPDKELDDEFDKMSYIMNDKQKEQYEVLKKIEDKRRYLYNFWRMRDDRPETPTLESRIAYMKRVNEANAAFRESYTDGWKSDRGRIYILYGKPDDIERYPYQASTKSYEVWIYNSVEGGGECDFIELQPSTGVYWLVNSTFREELQNPQWREQLNPR